MVTKTKNFIVGLAIGLAPAFFVVIVPMLIVGLLLAPPYSLVAWAIIAIFGWQFGRRRYGPDARDSHRAAG